MERLNNYNIKGYNLITWFFRLMIFMVAAIALLLFIVNINETVSIREGEIVAANPQSDYKAPFEAQLISANVREGQRISKGDTLLIIQSEDYISRETNKKAEIDYLKKRIQSIVVLRDALQKKKAAISQAGIITRKQYQWNISRLVANMKTIDEQYELQKQRLSSASERYSGDYKKEMLSKADYNSTKDASLLLKENMVTIKSEKQKSLTAKDLAGNNFNKEQNDLMLSRIELDENDQVLLQSKNDFENQLIQASEMLKQIQVELKKQYVIAENPGIVNYVFNTRQVSNLIPKGDLLISIAPTNMYYYAKAIIPQKDIRFVKSGLNARLKLDTYYRLEQGIMEGKVSYVAERKENDKFYALVELPRSAELRLRSGYSFQGEIVIATMPLYRYFIKKLFKKFDKE